MLLQIISIVFPIFAIVLVGFIYARRHAPDMAAANKVTIDIFIPALIFDVLSGKDFNLIEYQELGVGAAVIILGSGVIAWPVSRLLYYQFKTFVPPMMFSNYGNMGLPLALFAFGEQALPAAVVMFIVGNTLHFSVGMKLMDSSVSMLGLFRIPMLIATIAGLAISFLKIKIPQLLAVPIEMLGQIAIPLMLFALGVRLIHIDWRAWRIGLVGAILCPLSGLIIAVPLGMVLGLSDLQFAMLVVFGALPPAVLNYMVAERYGQEPQNVASIVMLGNLASVVVIPMVLAFVL
ncbi:AEC family transporter [Solemya velesiana gill symbiont]|uniref:Transporter n=1 Tax=Solemya velesiana gill symbiont TaxID=1918948 RepID=A0A1T2KSD1_9GAMM|nr:AEC family transporter [Solemya velesiana gill symbiont]OOZ35757.1 transporter [Solemya velesiana gill symbiont]